MAKKYFTNISILIIIGLLVYSCSLTKKVPEGDYLLTGNKVVVNAKGSPFKSDAPSRIKQKVNGKFLGVIPLQQTLYNWSDSIFDDTFTDYYNLSPNKRTQESLDSLLKKHDLEKYVGHPLWLDRVFFHNGKPPILLDTTATEFSRNNLEQFYSDKGYFDVKVGAKNIKNNKSKKGKVVYTVDPSERTKINSYNDTIKDSAINRYYTRLKKTSIVKANDFYDLDNFEAERDRIVEFLKNRGYYDFNYLADELYFTADSSQSDKALDVTLHIERTVTDSTGKFKKYRFNQINIYPDSRPNEENVKYIEKNFEGYNLYYKDTVKMYKERYFTDAMVIKPGQNYSLLRETQTKRNIFKRTNVNLISFSMEKEQDSLLNVNIYLQPKKKYDLNPSLEAFYANRYMRFGITPGITFTYRNLFGGGENWLATFKGTIGNMDDEFSTGGGFLNAYELSLENRLKFPYLLAPVLPKYIPKNYSSESDIRVGISQQKNIGLGRITYSTGLDFSISYREQEHKLFFFNTEFISNLEKNKYFDIFSTDNNIKNNIFGYYFADNPSVQEQYNAGTISDDNVISLISSDQNFQNGLTGDEAVNYVVYENMLFRKNSITQDVLINSLIYQYVFNQANLNRQVNNPFYFLARIEFAGNFLRLLDKTFGFNQVTLSNGNQAGSVFSIPYSQFIKIDLDVRKTWKVNSASSVASRFAFGIAQPFGNTDFIPFARAYSAGGANDIRGWAPLTIGPADVKHLEGTSKRSFAIENMKLLFSLEYRFKMFGSLEGALFSDMGNIWGTSKDRPSTMFEFKDFYKELAIGSGFGLRYDLKFLLFRLDFGYKMHDPSYEEGERWRIKDFNLLDPEIHFGINYPF